MSLVQFLTPALECLLSTLKLSEKRSDIDVLNFFAYASQLTNNRESKDECMEFIADCVCTMLTHLEATQARGKNGDDDVEIDLGLGDSLLTIEELSESLAFTQHLILMAIEKFAWMTKQQFYHSPHQSHSTIKCLSHFTHLSGNIYHVYGFLSARFTRSGWCDQDLSMVNFGTSQNQDRPMASTRSIAGFNHQGNSVSVPVAAPGMSEPLINLGANATIRPDGRDHAVEVYKDPVIATVCSVATIGLSLLSAADVKKLIESIRVNVVAPKWTESSTEWIKEALNRTKDGISHNYPSLGFISFDTRQKKAALTYNYKNSIIELRKHWAGSDATVAKDIGLIVGPPQPATNTTTTTKKTTKKTRRMGDDDSDEELY